MSHLFVLTFAAVAIFYASADTVKAKGKFFCPSDPKKAQNIRVRIVDKDIGNDDKIAETKTDSNGNFVLSGSGTDWFGKIDPQLNVYHNCLALTSVCERRHRFKIPKKYVNGAVFDLGVFNLETQPMEEDTKCSPFGGTFGK